MFGLFKKRNPPPTVAPTPERNLVAVMPPGTIMHFLQKNYPEMMTESGAINAGLFPTAEDAANWANSVTRHLWPDAICVLAPDLEYEKRWL